MADVITFFFPFSVFSKFLQNACIAYWFREKINSISEAKQGHESPPSCGQRIILLKGILAAHVRAHSSPCRNWSYRNPLTDVRIFTEAGLVMAKDSNQPKSLPKGNG